VTSSERDPVLGARRSARAVALRRARDVLVLDDGRHGAGDPLWVRVRDRARPDARVRVVTATPDHHAQHGAPRDVTDAEPGPHDGVAPDRADAALRVTPALPLSLVALDDTVVLVARTPHARAVTDRDAVLALRALAESEWDRARPADDALAPTEDTLLRLLAEGKTDSAVAARLGVSPRTVRRHAAGLMGRLGATSRFEAGARAAQRGWIRITDR